MHVADVCANDDGPHHERDDVVAGTDVSSVKIVRMGSAPRRGLFDDIRKAFQARPSGWHDRRACRFGAHPDGLPTPDLSIGYPVPEVRMRLVDGGNPDADRGELKMDCPAKTLGTQPRKKQPRS